MVVDYRKESSYSYELLPFFLGAVMDELLDRIRRDAGITAMFFSGSRTVEEAG
jgi:hypothetical protein